MDFLDPDKMRRHNLMVLIGYSLVGIAVLITALVLLYQSYGYGINREGQVIQNGLVFTASRVSGAEIWLNSSDSGFQTNKRLVLSAGDYVMQFNKNGYWPWTKSLKVEGSRVSRYDYALLFPRQLETTAVTSYPVAPGMSSQSLDWRWLLLQVPSETLAFDLYDLSSPNERPLPLTLPTGISTAATASSWKAVEWSSDNKHLLLEHNYDKSTEFILFDRESPAASVNINKTFGVNPSKVSLVNGKADQLYLYSSADKTLMTANLGDDATPRNYLRNVLAYETYGDNTVLYVTDDINETSSNSGMVAAKLTDGTRTYTISQMSPATHYVLDISKFSGRTYVAIGSDASNEAAVFRNPVEQINDPSIGVPVRAATLRVAKPTYLSFSSNSRFIVAERGTDFAVYDAEDDKTYSYNFTNQKFDAPQEHAVWMDGFRLMFVSGGKLLVFDFDQTNRRSLMAALPQYLPAFAPDLKHVYSLAPSAGPTGATQLTSTWLLTGPDR